ncbi:MAG: hypothetical protein PXY39_04260 [archaeon]|nr:hypothetical protein [archaeon]
MIKSDQVNNRLPAVRISVGVILSLLVLQFLMGMWLNLFATFPTISTSFGMMGIMGSIMAGGMGLLIAHMMSGFLLVFASVAVLAFSAYSGRTDVVLLGIAGLALIVLAGISGLIFMFSGFQNNLYSYLMAVGFIFAFLVYSLGLFISRPYAKSTMFPSTASQDNQLS